MKINHNISAAIANSQLSKTETRLTQSLERLSSGLKINRAADDPAGMAISQKMRTQIRGLSRASQNTLDGISVVETAEGALTEVEAMLQRMRELAVQAGNDTYGEEDKEAIQAEADALLAEIDRISKDTQFNKITLLDGSLDQRGYTNVNGIKVETFSESVGVGDYSILITGKAEKAVLVGDAMNPPAGLDGSGISAAAAGSITVNNVSVTINEGDTAEIVKEKLRETCEIAGVKFLVIDESAVPSTTDKAEDAGYTESSNVFSFTDTLKFAFVSEEFGSDQRVEISCDNSELSDLLGISTINDTVDKGEDIKIEFPTDSGFENSATVSAKGTYVTITDRKGFSMEISTDPNIALNTAAEIKVMDVGTMRLQIGANEGQTMDLKIPKITTESLRIDKLNYISSEGVSNAIKNLDYAISKVSAVRSKLGAYQNRLDHATSSLEVSEQNMTEALSRIEDVDMAEEMATYTQLNVLSQAGIAMLAQANDRPQTVLQLLQ